MSAPTTTERLKLRGTMEVPNVGWRVRMPEDDHLIEHQTYVHLVQAAKQYRKSKNYPIGSNFEGDVQNWMCQDLAERYCEPVESFDPEKATPAQKIVRIARELARWLGAGFPVVSEEIFNERMETCLACPYFNPNGNVGMGQCTAPGCGCTKIKLWLETSACSFPGGSKWRR